MISNIKLIINTKVGTTAIYFAATDTRLYHGTDNSKNNRVPAQGICIIFELKSKHVPIFIHKIEGTT